MPSSLIFIEQQRKENPTEREREEERDREEDEGDCWRGEEEEKSREDCYLFEIQRFLCLEVTYNVLKP